MVLVLLICRPLAALKSSSAVMAFDNPNFVALQWNTSSANAKVMLLCSELILRRMESRRVINSSGDKVSPRRTPLLIGIFPEK